MSITHVICFAILSMFQVSSCTSASNSDKNKQEVITDTSTKKEEPTTNPSTGWQVIAKGNQSAIQEARQVVIKSQAEFDKLWKEAFEGVTMTDPKPTVNFNEKWVVVGFLGAVSSGGHSIDVQEVKEDLITFKHVKPGRGCMSSMAIEYPFVMASIDQKIDKAGFKTVTEEKHCE